MRYGLQHLHINLISPAYIRQNLQIVYPVQHCTILDKKKNVGKENQMTVVKKDNTMCFISISFLLLPPKEQKYCVPSKILSRPRNTRNINHNTPKYEKHTQIIGHVHVYVCYGPYTPSLSTIKKIPNLSIIPA